MTSVRGAATGGEPPEQERSIACGTIQRVEVDPPSIYPDAGDAII